MLWYSDEGESSFSLARCAKCKTRLAATAAEKVGVLTDTKDYIAERAARADLKWFDRFMARKGGEPPSPDDALPAPAKLP